MTDAAKIISERAPGFEPEIGLVLGSGLSSLAEEAAGAVTVPYADLPGFPAAGVTGHGNDLVLGEIAGARVAILGGRAHYYEQGNAAAMRPALETIKALGATAVLLTNSAGSLKNDVGPGELMHIADHINYSGLNPLIGVEGDERFVDMTAAYDPDLGRTLDEAAERLGLHLTTGVYMWFSGPSFETPAEIRMAASLGADAVGMSTVPEVIIARYLGLRVAAVSMITNLGAGMTDGTLSHEQTKEGAALGVDNLKSLVRAFLEDFHHA